jgi:hypothetical protein
MFLWNETRTISQNVEIYKNSRIKKPIKLIGNNTFLILKARLKNKIRGLK